MFSGIIESVQPILHAHVQEGVLRLKIQKPVDFNDLKVGDSISVNGVCLTVEAQVDHLNPDTIQFAVGYETQMILGWQNLSSELVGRQVNLERSLRWGDRIHGHLVSGHVDGLGRIEQLQMNRGCLLLEVSLPPPLLPFVWKKGSLSLQGVSLTVNEVQGTVVSVCLIPETLARTNLAKLSVGEMINVEADYVAKALQNRMSYLNEGSHESV